ncbi:hypothetical protein DFJ74DRAFT_691296, partial [Hyaloraphidium curvatum]
MLMSGNAVVGYGPERPHIWSTRIAAKRSAKPNLLPGEWLRPGYFLRSKNGYYWLQMNANGALQLFAQTPSTGARIFLWETRTEVAGSSARFLQGVLSVRAPNGTVLWTSTPGPTAGNVLQMQEDGNLVIFNRTNPSRFYWQTYTSNPQNSQLRANDGTKSILRAGQQLVSGNGFYRLTMLPNGNAALYFAPTSTPIWQTGTWGNPGAYMKFLGDGNLVVLNKAGNRTLWQSFTSNTRGIEVVVTNDGNLMMFTADYQCVWQIGPVVSSNNRISAGGALRPGRFLQSSNGLYKLYLSPTTGSLWLYQNNPNPVNPLWTAPPLVQEYNYYAEAMYYYEVGAPNSTLVLKRTGELVLVAPNGTTVWIAGTPGPQGNYTLSLTDHGNLMITSQSGQRTWQTSTDVVRGSSMTGGSVLYPGQMLRTPDSQYTLNFTTACDLIMYRMDGSWVWQSDTAVAAGSKCKAMFTQDGALAIYAGSEYQYGLWNSGTGGNSNAIMLLQEDGYVSFWSGNTVTLLGTLPTVSTWEINHENKQTESIEGASIKLLIKALL